MPDEVIALVAVHDLDLVDYRAYDVDRAGARQYQLLAFARPAEKAHAFPAGGAWRRLAARIAALPFKPFQLLRRLAQALRLWRAGRGRAARWVLGRGGSTLDKSER